MPRLAALAAVCLLVACDTGTEEVPLLVDLGGAFDDTLVHVEVDGRTVFEGRATTGAVLATAGIYEVEVSEGEHHGRAAVEGRLWGEIAVHTDTTVTVGVSYDPEAGAVSLQAFRYRPPTARAPRGRRAAR